MSEAENLCLSKKGKSSADPFCMMFRFHVMVIHLIIQTSVCRWLQRYQNGHLRKWVRFHVLSPKMLIPYDKDIHRSQYHTLMENSVTCIIVADPLKHYNIQKLPKQCSDYIVWSESTCPTLTRWVLEFGFQFNISLECGPYEKLNKLNRIRLYSFLKNDLPGLDLKIR
jgi:hypothetical protein